MSKVTGKVSQIIGPVVVVEFQSGADLQESMIPWKSLIGTSPYWF